MLDITARALERLARLTLRRYRPGVVGITGNVGKTSTKEAVRAVLSADRRVRAPSKNFNNEFGMPLTVLGGWEKTGGAQFWLKVFAVALCNIVFRNRSYPELLVLEYGVDVPGDMKKLISIARPHIGVVTAIGDLPPVHVEFFAGREGLIREKTKLVAALPGAGFAVLNADDPAVSAMREATRARSITFGFSENADVRVSNLEQKIENGTGIVTFKMNYGSSFVPVRIEGALGRTQAYAAAAAVAVGCAFGINIVKSAEALTTKYFPPRGRLRVLKGMRGSVIIDDTYNAAPLSMREALETIQTLKAKRKICILGDMLELGKYSIEAHVEIGRIAARTCKMLVTVGERGKLIAEGAAAAGLPKKAIFAFNTTGEAAKFLTASVQEKDLLLVKASQGVRLEKVVKELLADPAAAGSCLVRQEPRWLEKSGMYEEAPIV